VSHSISVVEAVLGGKTCHLKLGDVAGQRMTLLAVDLGTSDRGAVAIDRGLATRKE
jgi:hypothetical protein